MSKKHSSLILLFFIPIIFFIYSNFNKKTPSIAEKIHSIPEKQRQDLECFFYFIMNPCAYTLFGDKPISLIVLNDFPHFDQKRINYKDEAIYDVFLAIHSSRFMQGY